jgi:hypothetical protein
VVPAGRPFPRPSGREAGPDRAGSQDFVYHKNRGHLSITAMGIQEYPGWVMTATASRRSGLVKRSRPSVAPGWRRLHN